MIFWIFFSYFVSHSWGIPMMRITGLSHLFKWENLHNWWLTKYFFAPLYLDKGTMFIILAADQNVFKLQLYIEYGLKVHTLSFNSNNFHTQHPPPPISRGSNVIGQINVIINKILIFYILWMAVLSLELMDLTRDRFPLWCFTAADFCCCLFVGLSVFSFVFRKWNACSILLTSGNWLGHCRIFHSFTFKN